MSFEFSIVTAAGGLFLGMLLCFDLGRRIGVRRLVRDPEGLAKGSGPVEAAVFGLVGLLLAFTFSGAGSRFEIRRHLIAEETNAIGTAYLRIDLLPANAQSEIRQLFRRYVDFRVKAYQNVENTTATRATLSEGADLQDLIWAKAVSASKQPETPTHAPMLLLPALNEMFDITTTRAVATQDHPPRVIYFLLSGLSLVSSLLLGYVMCGTKVRNWFYVLLVAVTMSLTFYVILDLEYPRHGLIRIDAADQALMELHKRIQ